MTPTGQWFGDGEDGSKLYIGSHALTSTGILEWEDNRILARVPRSDGAVLVKVKTRSGTSQGVILGDWAWVAGTGALLLLKASLFSGFGLFLLLDVAALVAVFAMLQSRGLRLANEQGA